MAFFQGSRVPASILLICTRNQGRSIEIFRLQKDESSSEASELREGVSSSKSSDLVSPRVSLVSELQNTSRPLTLVEARRMLDKYSRSFAKHQQNEFTISPEQLYLTKTHPDNVDRGSGLIQRRDEQTHGGTNFDSCLLCILWC